MELQLQSTLQGTGQLVLSWVLLWVLGLVFGWMLPRPKWLQRGLRSKALFLATPPGLWVRRATLAFHGALIVRHIWRYFHTPGTFRALARAVWVSVRYWQPFEWPQLHHDGKVLSDPEALGQAGLEAELATDDTPGWYVGPEDLAFFRSKVESEPEGAKKWDHMMDLAYEGTTYSSWRRALPNGKTEYKSITLTPNASAEEFMDFYLDDPTRPKWDNMISEYSVVEGGPDAQRCLVVRWKRTFPFSFISSREYVIARRLFRAGDALYGITKGIPHAAVPEDGKLVRCGTFYSMWRCRTIPCPYGSGRPACETVLLHHEDMKVPERLAKFAVRHGMPGFFKGMVPQVKEFVARRRIHLGTTDVDPQAYGVGWQPAPVAPAAPAAAPPSPARSASLVSDAGSEDSFGTQDSAFGYGYDGQPRSGLRKSPSLRRLGYMMLASGVALAIAKTNSSPNLAAEAAAGPTPEPGSASSGSSAQHGHKRHRTRGGKGGQPHSHSHPQQQQQQGGGGRRRLRPQEVAMLSAVCE